MDLNVYINGSLRTDLAVRRMTRSYVAPWSCELEWSGRHDRRPVRQWDRVIVDRADTGARLFRGNVVQVSPGGVAREGIEILALGRRFRLENEPVNINGSGQYVWNRRGHVCGHESGEDSPGQDGGKWTAGEIIIDILEHALGIPGCPASCDSDIPGHHGSCGCVTDTYLTSADISGYVAADWLALDSVIGEFSVDNTPVASAISELVALNGGFYGWFIDEWGVLRLIDLGSCPETLIEAGELGHWQDEAGRDYRLLDNRLDWTLDGVYSSVMVQGTDRTVEVKPSNLDGCGNAALNGGGELELVAQPWKDYACAFRALDQPYRRWTWKGVGFSGSCENWRETCECGIPAGLGGIWSGARIYRGTDAGAKTIVSKPTAGLNWRVNLATGIVMFYWDVAADLAVGEKLWGWYWARVPFTVTAGPDGSAYDCLGYQRTLKLYDPAFKHPASYPVVGTEDDETAMGILAERLLDQVKDIRVQGRIVCDDVDPSGLNLLRRYSVSRLGVTTTTEAPGTTAACAPDPLDWGALRLNAVEAVYDFASRTTTLTLANTFWMLEGYSAIKERLRLNLFAQRELDLSEDILECQVGPASESPDDETTVTEWPTTTSTAAPTTTTTTPGPCNGCDPPLPAQVHVTLCHLGCDFLPFEGDHALPYIAECLWGKMIDAWPLVPQQAWLQLEWDGSNTRWIVTLQVQRGNACYKRWAHTDVTGCDPWSTTPTDYAALDCVDDTCQYHTACENSAGATCEVTQAGESCPTEEPYCESCESLAGECYRATFSGCCNSENYTRKKVCLIWGGTEEDMGNVRCYWFGDLEHRSAPGTTTTTQCPGGEPSDELPVTLLYHVSTGWLLWHGEAWWAKLVHPLDPCDPTGEYECVVGGCGTATVERAWCGPCATTAVPGTTAAPGTTTTAAPTTTTTTAAPPSGCCCDCYLTTEGQGTIVVPCNDGAPCAPAGCSDATGDCVYEETAGRRLFGTGKASGNDCLDDGVGNEYIYAYVSDTCSE